MNPEPLAEDSLSIQFEERQQRYILTQVGHLTFVFPLNLVTEIPIVERSQILAVPFYPPEVLGVLHHAGQILPLISLRQLLGMTTGLTAERLTVVQLSSTAAELAGVGIVVDRTLGMRLPAQLPPELFNAAPSPDSPHPDPNMRLFQSELLTARSWQPLRWQST